MGSVSIYQLPFLNKCERNPEEQLVYVQDIIFSLNTEVQTGGYRVFLHWKKGEGLLIDFVFH